ADAHAVARQPAGQRAHVHEEHPSVARGQRRAAARRPARRRGRERHPVPAL
ncbi:MAG: hypothetical protein AVDCRST_MAG53-3342, partial [uncultured Solirubrobacteraceae bacterium]